MDTDTIHQQRVMQLATVRGDQPWICTVYFVVHEGSFYWLSFPERRHSREVASNPRVAITVAIKQDIPVVGLQAEGDVAEVTALDEIEGVLARYAAKYSQGQQFVERFKTGENHHVLYRMKPRKVMVFDELNHSDEPYREVTIER